MLAPHVPADWTSFAIHNVRAGGGTVDFQYRKTADTIVLETSRAGSGDCWVDFSPALSLRGEVVGAEIGGRSLPFKTEANSNDQHVHVRFPMSSGTNSVVIRVKNDFGIAVPSELPALGSASGGLRVVSEIWNANKSQLTLSISGLAGKSYELEVWNPGQISSADGAVLTKLGKLQFEIFEGPAGSYVQRQIVLHFGKSH
jgi:hypothetical protein